MSAWPTSTLMENVRFWSHATTPTTTPWARSISMPTNHPTGKSSSTNPSDAFVPATPSSETSMTTLIPKSFSWKSRMTITRCTSIVGVIVPKTDCKPFGSTSIAIPQGKQASHFSTSTKTKSWSSFTATATICVSSTAAARAISPATTPSSHTTFIREEWLLEQDANTPLLPT